jgi:hypothetical protein
MFPALRVVTHTGAKKGRYKQTEAELHTQFPNRYSLTNRDRHPRLLAA